jgi:hypothetical protein
MVYELIGIRDTTDPELSADDGAMRICAMTTGAMAALTAGHRAEARAKYHEILAETPADPVARFMFNELAD